MMIVVDGNYAAAYVAYRVSDICAIYPITPSSSMGELADKWSSTGIPNIWGTVPCVIEMQSEAGASGTLHGAAQAGGLTTTFTSSQGLLLMIPNMFQLAAELTPTVFHVATRAVAYQGMSIYCDHSDVMAVRTTGFAMLNSVNVQEAHDMALLSHAASLQSKIPFLHFFDGMHTSHEIENIVALSDEQIRAMIEDDNVLQHRNNGHSSDNPKVRGVVHSIDMAFQAREIVNSYYNKVPEILSKLMEQFKKVTQREYHLIEYFGAKDAEVLIAVMGSAADTVRETVEHLIAHGEKVAVMQIRLFRPFPQEEFLRLLPQTCKAIAVLDRTKEIGAVGEPLYEEVATTLLDAQSRDIFVAKSMPKIIGGRFGLSSKDFTPAMVKAIFDELKKKQPKNHFTIGINDDVTNTSLDYDEKLHIGSDYVAQAILYGYGSDGTLSASKSALDIVAKEAKLHVRGRFVFDAKKSGSVTMSHLRFSHDKIYSSHLIFSADFIGCHQFNFVKIIDVLEHAAPGAIFLLNSPYSATEVWEYLPFSLQQTIVEKKIKFYVIDALTLAEKEGIAPHINIIMQVCFFALTKLIPLDVAIVKIKEMLRKSYASKGEAVIEKNFRAVDHALINLSAVSVPDKVSLASISSPLIDISTKKNTNKTIAALLHGGGDKLPVSKFPADGAYYTNTTHLEKHNITRKIPVWNHDLCMQCGQCSFVCPHSVIRAKRYDASLLEQAPKSFKAAKLNNSKNQDKECYSLQVYLEDCTGCGLCVETCPVKKTDNKLEKKALSFEQKANIFSDELQNIKYFESLPINILDDKNLLTVKDVQYLPPMFEFCSACAGCGEASYLKLLSQLFGDRLVIANTCGCSSVFGAHMASFPWTINSEGRGPAWSCSLFEDNAEFGLGFRLTADKQREFALELVEKLAPNLDNSLVSEILAIGNSASVDITKQRNLVATLKDSLNKMSHPLAKQLLSVANQLVEHSIWAIGGDGWAYDIGFGGLDHVLASGYNVNVLVLDTEVYSNTGGQSSKATPKGAIAKFAAKGKNTPKKDLGYMMMSYDNVYIANISIGANPLQAIKAFKEAESYNGPSLIMAYSHCIAHGINTKDGLKQQKLAVKCGHWPLYRYDPRRISLGLNPFQLDSPKPSIPFKEYASNENRYKLLMQGNPSRAEEIFSQTQQDIEKKWKRYTELLNYFSLEKNKA